MSDQKPTHISTTDARGGSTPHIVRYILLISLVLVVVSLAVVLGFGWIA